MDAAEGVEEAVAVPLLLTDGALAAEAVRAADGHAPALKPTPPFPILPLV